MRELREPPRNLGLADAGRADHDDVLRRDLVAQIALDLLPAPAVPERDGDRALGILLPDDGIVAVGSGGPFAMAAARALVKHSGLGAREIAQEAMTIAADICIYTNPNLTIEEL